MLINEIRNEYDLYDFVSRKLSSALDNNDDGTYNRLQYASTVFDAALSFYRSTVNDGEWQDMGLAVSRVKLSFDDLMAALFVDDPRNIEDEEAALKYILKRSY